MNPHRKPGERDERPDLIPPHVGPRASCPFCGVGNIARCPLDGASIPLAFGDMMHVHPKNECSSANVMMVAVERVTHPVFCRGSFWRRCALKAPHLHQRCKVCGGAWLCAPQEAP